MAQKPSRLSRVVAAGLALLFSPRPSPGTAPNANGTVLRDLAAIECFTGLGTTQFATGEGGNLNASCPAGSVITAVPFASYGTPTGACPDYTVSPACGLDVRTAVEAACLGKASCSLTESNSAFGSDPCFGTVKYTFATAACSELQA